MLSKLLKLIEDDFGIIPNSLTIIVSSLI